MATTTTPTSHTPAAERVLSTPYRHLACFNAESLHPTLADLLLYVDDSAATADAFLSAVRMVANAHPECEPVQMLAHLGDAVAMSLEAGAGGVVDHAYKLQREIDAQQADDNGTSDTDGAR